MKLVIIVPGKTWTFDNNSYQESNASIDIDIKNNNLEQKTSTTVSRTVYNVQIDMYIYI